MRILTLENQTYHLDKVPDEIEEDIRFSVLDNSNPILLETQIHQKQK